MLSFGARFVSLTSGCAPYPYGVLQNFSMDWKISQPISLKREVGNVSVNNEMEGENRAHNKENCATRIILTYRWDLQLFCSRRTNSQRLLEGALQFKKS